MSLYAPIVSTLGVLTLVALVAALALFVTVLAPGGRGWLVRTFTGHERHPLAWAWLVALLAMSGSLYLSDVVGLLPCLFCWYQRIAMYPLVLVLGVGVLRADAGVWRYGLPLSVVGLGMAAYHVALQWNPALEVVSCSRGAPCSGRYLSVFGFVSIPAMAGAAFLLITALLLAVRVVERSASRATPHEPAGGGVG